MRASGSGERVDREGISQTRHVLVSLQRDAQEMAVLTVPPGLWACGDSQSRRHNEAEKLTVRELTSGRRKRPVRALSRRLCARYMPDLISHRGAPHNTWHMSDT